MIQPKKKRKRTPPRQAAIRVENPAWLATEPTGRGVNPPIQTKPIALPLLELSWEDFERLCLRLAQKAGAVEKVWAYGTSGYSQLGIDILVRMQDGSFAAWQSKRQKTFGPAAVKKAVSTFLEADWAKQAKRFVLAVACDVNSPRVVDALENARTTLSARGIAFEPLFAKDLTERLRSEAEIIDDFFGRAWVHKVCPEEVAAAMADRLSRFDMHALRADLHDLYMHWIATVDPGLPLIGQGRSDIPTPELRRRYVLPDVLLDSDVGEHDPSSLGEDEQPRLGQATEEVLYRTKDDTYRASQVSRARAQARRTGIIQFLAGATRAIISGEAGSGKTTLLRHLALEILSDSRGPSDVDRKSVV